MSLKAKICFEAFLYPITTILLIVASINHIHNKLLKFDE